MSDAKMTPEQAAVVAAGIAVASTFATASGNPAIAGSVAAAVGLLNSVLAAGASGVEYTMADYQKAMADFAILDAAGHALQDAAP